MAVRKLEWGSGKEVTELFHLVLHSYYSTQIEQKRPCKSALCFDSNNVLKWATLSKVNLSWFALVSSKRGRAILLPYASYLFFFFNSQPQTQYRMWNLKYSCEQPQAKILCRSTKFSATWAQQLRLKQKWGSIVNWAEARKKEEKNLMFGQKLFLYSIEGAWSKFDDGTTVRIYFEKSCFYYQDINTLEKNQHFFKALNILHYRAKVVRQLRIFLWGYSLKVVHHHGNWYKH